MPVLAYPFGPLEANAYLVHNNVDAVVIDPPIDTALILDRIKESQLMLRAVLLTHLHIDHVLGVPAMTRATGLPAHVGRQEWEFREILLAPQMRLGFPPIEEFEELILEPGEIRWGSLGCQVFFAPGHSPGSLCYYFPSEKALIAGDVIFYRSIGRSDFPGGNFDQLCNSIRTNIYTLPKDTVIYPGHFQPTTVEGEARHNPFCPA